MGSQNRKRGDGGSGESRARDRSTESSLQAPQNLVRLVKDKKFRIAARIGVGIAMKITHTDVIADAAIAAAKGYKYAERHGAEEGAKTATKEFVTRQVTGITFDAIAGNAVSGMPDGPTREIVKDAISEALDATFGSLT